MSLFAEIALPLPITKTFIYSVPQAQAQNIRTGARVLVPFGQRILTGFVVGLRKKLTTEIPSLKEIKELLDEEPVFTPSFLLFTKKLSASVYSSWGELLQASLPPSFVLKAQSRVSLTKEGRELLAENRFSGGEKKLALHLRDRTYSVLFLRKKMGADDISHVLSRMEKKGLVEVRTEIAKPVKRKAPQAEEAAAQLELDFSLDSSLEKAAAEISEVIGKNVFRPFYLYGSRERREAVYGHLLRRLLTVRGTAIYLVPEVSLTEDLREKLARRLGETITVLHSRLSEAKREFEWKKVRGGLAGVILGARSALFSPVKNLRLVIVDEEQDESYLQQTSPAYDARSGAWLRAREERAVLVFGSAFPSIEAFFNAEKGGYLVDLGGITRRYKATIVDSRHDSGLVSRALKEGIEERLKRQERVYVYFNRRGYALYLLCSRCRHVPRCSRCDVALAYHKAENRLVCHFCRYSTPKMEACPSCGTRLLVKKGAGVEAVGEELQRLFPSARVRVMESDTVRGKKEGEGVVRELERGEVDILVGTKLMAHQTRLPRAMLVGVLSPEQMLTLADFRSGEKTFLAISSMTSFLAGDDRSELIVQTSFPEHYSIREAAFGNYRGYLEEEIRFRRLMNYPPFSRMAEVTLEGRNLRKLAEKARELSAGVKASAEKVEVLGPGRAPAARLKGLYRIQLMLRAQKKGPIHRVLRALPERTGLKKSVIFLG